MNETHSIGLVDDEPGMLRALSRLLRENGFITHVYSSGEEFLRDYRRKNLDCAILDLMMPNLDGLALQKHLHDRNINLPIIFLTGHGDIPSTVQAIKEGAINFLTKPVDQNDLFNSLRLALIEGRKTKQEDEELRRLRKRGGQLTDREIEVLRHVVSGQMNKQIAADLGIREQTIKVHRMNITKKLDVHSVAQLVRVAEKLGIEPVELALD